MKPLVVVLGKNYSTALGVIRALGKQDYAIDLFYVAGKKGDSRIAACSKSVRRCIEHVGRTDELIIHRLLSEYENVEQQCVLFPTDDYTASLIDQYREELEPCFFMPYIEGHEQGAITRMMSKSIQLEYAKRFDFNIAKTWEISLQLNRITIPEDIIFPCFCKPEVSAKGFKSEISVCKTKDELHRKLIDLQKRRSDRTVLIQEFLQIDEEYSISGVCLGNVVVLPALLKKLCIAEHEKGVTLMGRVDPFDEIGNEKEKLMKLLSSFGYFGMIDIELIRCGNEIYFNELNFRSSGVCYGIIAAGVNLPLMLVENLLGMKIKTDIPKIKYGMTFLYDKAAWEDYIFGEISVENFQKFQSSTDIFILENVDDPEPGRIFAKMMRRKRYKHKVKQVIKRVVPDKYVKFMLGRN